VLLNELIRFLFWAQDNFRKLKSLQVNEDKRKTDFFRTRISERKFREFLKRFCVDVEVSQATQSTHIPRPAISRQNIVVAPSEFSLALSPLRLHHPFHQRLFSASSARRLQKAILASCTPPTARPTFFCAPTSPLLPFFFRSSRIYAKFV
jgi:hypothetical protein